MKSAIALAVVGAALMAVAGSQPWFVIAQSEVSGSGYYTTQPSRSIEFSLNDLCQNETSSYGGFGYYGCISYDNGGPYGVRGVSRGAGSAASLAFGLALAEAALIGIAAAWPRSASASRWAGVLSVAFAALAITVFTVLIPSNAGKGYSDEWKVNFFFGGQTISGGRIAWGPGIGWYLAIAALVVLILAFIRSYQAGNYLAAFPPVQLNGPVAAGARGAPGGPLYSGQPIAPSAGRPPTPPPTPMIPAAPAPASMYCSNCRNVIFGPFCSTCGQRNM